MSNHKEAYIAGLKDGLTMGIEKGIEISETWMDCSDCPPANSQPMLVESSPVTEQM